MLEKVKAAIVQFDKDMQRADDVKAKSLAALDKLFEVPSKKTGRAIVPQKVKSTEAYSSQYTKILAEYESAVKAAREKGKADAESALIKVKADCIVFSQKAPDDATLNSIKALSLIDPGNVTREELTLVAEASRNYLASKSINQIALNAGVTLPFVTLADVTDLLDNVSKEVAEYFYNYNPLSYKTMAMVRGSNPVLNAADSVIDSFMQGVFTVDASLINNVAAIKGNSSEAEAAAKKKRAEEIDKKAASLTEAEKLGLYLS